LAWPHAFAWAFTLAGLATLTNRPAACRYEARASEYGPVASRQKWTAAPAACRSAQASRAAWPSGSLANRLAHARPPGPGGQASRVALLTSIPTKCVAAVVAVPMASLPSASRCGVALARVARGVASEVEERRRPGRTLVPEVGCLIRCLRLVRPPGVASSAG